MKNLYNKLVNANKSSILMFLGGLITQIVTYPFLLILGTNFHRYERVMFFVLALSTIWFCIPVISIVGIIIAITQIHKRNGLKLPIIGMILNIIWFILFSFVVYMIFVVGITV